MQRDYELQLKKARKDARDMLVVAAVCLELTFLFSLFIVHHFIPSLSALVVLVGLCLLVPVATFCGWKREVRKSQTFQVLPHPYSLPYAPKVRMLGGQLIFTADRICSISKQNTENREVPYSDILKAEVSWKGAYIFHLTRRSGKLSLKLNLSLCDKDEWPSIIDVVAVQAPQAQLNDLARDIREGCVPYF
jgi:hypothetical protein